MSKEEEKRGVFGRVKLQDKVPVDNCSLTPQLLLVTKIEFLLTTSIQYQAGKW